MDAVVVEPVVQNFIGGRGRRVSWAAILAGVVVTLVTQLMLSLLGIAIGASTVDPLREADPTSGLGVGAGIWWVVTGLISLFAGGWTAGHLAGVPRGLDSMLHGILTWGIATLLTFYLLTSAVGGIIGGAARALAGGATALGQTVAAVAPQAAEAARGQMREQGINVDSIRDEVRTLLKQTGKPELQPDALKDKAEKAKDEATESGKAAAQNPQAAQGELDSLIDRLYKQGAGVASAADRDALINVLSARTGKSREESAQIVDRWNQTFQQARHQVGEMKEEAGQKAREVGDAAAKGVSRAAFWSFLTLLSGLVAAALGGRAGVAHDHAHPHVHETARPSSH